ncbi:MAG: hypothetical protein IPK71_03185 [Myxococcales bacterium]|nr:hypothetical protein [Myxococcales bacterium]
MTRQPAKTPSPTTKAPKKKGAASAKAPKKGAASAKAPKKGAASAKAPKKGAASAKAPKKGAASTKAPKKGAASAKAPKKGAASTKAPKKGAASTKAPKKGAASTKAPKKGAASTKAPAKKTARAYAAPASMVARATQNDVSSVYRGREAHFLALRKKDPAASLRERLEAIAERSNSDQFQVDFGYASGLLARGWAVIAVPEDRVIYTLGLHYHFGQPEVMLGDQPLDEQPGRVAELTALLNELGDHVASGLRLGAGDAVEIGGLRLALHAFGDDDFDRMPCGYLATFEEMFEDRFHEVGSTLPVLRATLA